MNKFLKSRAEADQATKYLQENGLTLSGLSCKNWETVQALPHLKDGALLDMGSDGSILLENAVKIGIKGIKVGVDLTYAEDKVLPDGTNLIKGDLMNTNLEDEYFDTITCLSVVEHEVNFTKFATEVSRLLKSGGTLIVSFDFAPEKIDTSLTKLYDLSWNVLDKINVHELISELKYYGLALDGEIDWTLGEMVINETYCAPTKGVAYTFGILKFIKA